MPERGQKKPAGSAKKPKHSADKIREYELAGGVEGGMPAGSAGGPGESDAEDESEKRDR